jgi:hypothetical protein
LDLDEKKILGSWTHAHELDRQVFVDAKNQLAPSRMRRKIIFLTNGRYTESRVGQDDRQSDSSGTFELKDGVLKMNRELDSSKAVFLIRLWDTDLPIPNLCMRRGS